MLNRFIGNKKPILNPLLECIQEYAAPGDLVCDIFSGTLAVSLALKSAGYLVASNDINLFSYVYGRAYLTNSAIPYVDLKELIGQHSLERAKRRTPSSQWSNGDSHHRFMALLNYLSTTTTSRLPRRYRRSDIRDTYSDAGKNSYYRSSRGREGSRRFFSPENAARIDSILNWLRFWRDRETLGDEAHYMVLCCLLDAVERVSNIQGTYHDFPRSWYDPRALRPLRLLGPDVDRLGGVSEGHILGMEEDSLEFIDCVRRPELMYVDPPYNFRQYTSYYFLPNLICRYCTIPDLDEYFARVEFVRGQNMSDDFDSSFSRRSSFIDSLHLLMAKSTARIIVLSYFDGRNHWGKPKDDSGEGLRHLTELFTSDLFVPGSFKMIPIARRNYQSYVGYQAEPVEEMLLVGERHASTDASLHPQALAMR